MKILLIAGAAIVVLGILVFAFQGDDEAENTAGSAVGEAVDTAVEGAGEAVEDAGQAVEGAGEAVQDAAGAGN